MDSLITKSTPQTTSVAFFPTPDTDDPKVATKIPPAANMQALAESVGEQSETVTTLQNQQLLDEPVVQLSDSNIYTILAALQQTLRDGSMNTLAARLNVNTTLSAQHATNYADALAATEAAKQKYQDALADFDAKNQALAAADGNLSDKTEQRDLAQSRYNASQAALAARAQDLAQSPNDPQVQAKYDAALTEFNNASQNLNSAGADYDSALQARDAAASAAIAAGQAAVAAQAEVTLCIDDLTRLGNEAGVAVPITTPDEIKTAMRILQECMARLAEILDKANEDKLNNNLKLYRQKQEQLQKECEQAAKDYQKAVEEAARQQKKMKLIGKIVGGLITGLSIGAAVVSGGALMALIPAAVGAAVLIADEILDSQGKQTASSYVMDPIINPIMQGLTDKFVDFLKLCDKSISDEVAQATATAMAMVTVFVAGAIVTSGAGKLADKIPVIKDALAKLSTMRLSSWGDSAAAIKAGGAMRVGTSAAQLSNSGFQGVMGGYVAFNHQDAKEALAETKDIDAILNLIKKVLDQIVNDYPEGAKMVAGIQKNMSEWIAQDNQASRHVIRNVAA